MESGVFGSYSLTEFKDLYDLNLRSHHSYSIFFEVDHDGIVRFVEGKIDHFNKKNENSYLIGILTHDLDYLTLEQEFIKYFESHSGNEDINYLMNTKKKFIYLTYENGKITFISTKDISLYMSENHSFSSTPANGYYIIKPNFIYNIPLFKEKKFITDKRK